MYDYSVLGSNLSSHKSIKRHLSACATLACAVHAGCPIDIICERGAGSALLTRPKRLEQVVRATTACINKPVIVKIR
jgi:tRNA-dihydrouridine synthase